MGRPPARYGQRFGPVVETVVSHEHYSRSRGEVNSRRGRACGAGEKLGLTYWNSNIIMTLWNSKSEVITCLHGQDDRKQKTQSQQTLKLELMILHQKGLTNIARPTASRGRKQSDGESICFCPRKNKTNLPALLYLGGRTARGDRHRPSEGVFIPCRGRQNAGGGKSIIANLPGESQGGFFYVRKQK